MQLEFGLDADGLNRLGRLKALAATREGRPRTSTVRFVWHDSPDGALRNAGLALAEHRGEWYLERLFPGVDTWLPAHATPILAHATNLTELQDIPSPLAPMAAFEGRRLVSTHALESGPVTMTILRGGLRAVTAERSTVRLALKGDPEAVRAAMTLISATTRLTVPKASLAAEAIAMATGGMPQARHFGAPSLPDPALLTVTAAVRHILGHLLDVMHAHAPAAVKDEEAAIEAVHQMRVAVRRARSALSLFRPIMSVESHELLRDRLKALGSRLGARRDWDVFVEETIPIIRDGLAEGDPLPRLAAAAERHRRDNRRSLSVFLESADFANLTVELAWCIAALPEPVEPTPTLAAFAAAVLAQRRRKLAAAGKRIDELDMAGLHDVRLRAKQVRYAAEMFAALHPGRPAQRFIKRLSVMQQRLGVMNDGAVATQLLDQLGGGNGRHAYAAGIVTGFLAARTASVRPGIVQAYRKWRRQPPYWT